MDARIASADIAELPAILAQGIVGARIRIERDDAQPVEFEVPFNEETWDRDVAELLQVSGNFRFHAEAIRTEPEAGPPRSIVIGDLE